MKKKYFSLLALTAILITSSFFYKPAAASSSGFKQGDQYQPGLYDLQAESPTPYNWTRNSPFYSVESNPTLKWELKLSGNVRGNPTIGSDGTIYVASADRKINAVNNDGTFKWSAEKDPTSASLLMGLSAVIGEDGTLYAGSTAFNPDGTQKWVHAKGNDGRNTTNAIDANGNIYYTGYSTLYSLDSNGNENWSYKVAPKYSDEISPPSIGTDGTIYIALGPETGTPGMIALNPDGTVKWRLAVDSSVAMSSVYGGYGSIAIGKDGTLYFGITSNTFYAVNPDGTVKWTYKTTEQIMTGTTIGIDGSIIFGSRDKSLYALNEDGTLNWNYKTGTFPNEPAPIVDKNGNIYLQVGGHLTAITSSGKFLWKYNLEGINNSGAIAIGKDGTIYVVNGSKLTAITGDIKKEIDFCEVYSNLKGLTEEDLSSQETREQAKRDLELLKAELNKIENKIIQAESSQP